MMNINDLPNDCFILIMRRFELSHLIRLRSICTHWQTMIESMLLLKRSLKLFSCHSDIEQYCNRLIFTNDDGDNVNKLIPIRNVGFDDDLILESRFFDFQFCDLLSTLFASIEHLVIYIGKPDVNLWRRVPYLLKLWPDLRSLSLHGCSEQLGITNRLSLAIDSLFSLTNLDLSLHYTEETEEAVPLNLPQVLSQLEQLSLSLYKYKGDISPMVERLSSNCHKLNLEWEHLSITKFTELFTHVNPSLVDKITHLTLRCVKGNDYITFVCRHFVSLQYLSILFSSLTMVRV